MSRCQVIGLAAGIFQCVYHSWRAYEPHRKLVTSHGHLMENLERTRTRNYESQTLQANIAH